MPPAPLASPLDGLYETRVAIVRFPNQSSEVRARQPAGPERSTSPINDFSLLQSLRAVLYTHAKSIALCGRGVIGSVASVMKEGRLVGIMRCHNSNVCPVCAPAMACARMAQARVCIGEARQQGYRVIMATFTSKPQGLPLVEELAAYDAAMSEFARSLSGRASVLGYINARDMTRAKSGSWNPHRHLIIVVRDDTNLDRLGARLIEKWLRCIRAQGGKAIAAAQLVEEVPVQDDNRVITYVLSAPLKRGEEGDGDTIRDIAVAAGTGDRQAACRLNEYAAAIKGRRAVSSGGVLRLSKESEEVELFDEDRVVDLEPRGLLDLDHQGLLDGLVRRVAGAVDDWAKRAVAHVYLSEHLPNSRYWFIDWTGHEHLYYSAIDPGEPFDYSGPEWDERDQFDAPAAIAQAEARLVAAIQDVMTSHPGISYAVALQAVRATPGFC